MILHKRHPSMAKTVYFVVMKGRESYTKISILKKGDGQIFYLSLDIRAIST